MYSGVGVGIWEQFTITVWGTLINRNRKDYLMGRKIILRSNLIARSSTDSTKSWRLLRASAVFFALSALAQSSSAAMPPNSPGATPGAPATATTPAVSTLTKVGTINMQEAIVDSNEGHREMETLQRKFAPTQAELKNKSDELEALKKQVNTQGANFNQDGPANLKIQIESKQKALDRAVQDAQEDFTNQQQKIAERILNKMAPTILKYSRENGFTLIVDTSKPWPQSPVLWSAVAIDITKAVIEAYNIQSGSSGSNSGAGTSSGTDYDQQLKTAMALWKNNQASEANNATAALIKSDPKRWEGYGLAGAIEKAQNRFPQAKAAYEQALSLAPDSVKPQITQAIQQIEAEQKKP